MSTASLGCRYTIDEIFLEVDRPRFKDSAPRNIVVFAYVPLLKTEDPADSPSSPNADTTEPKEDENGDVTANDSMLPPPSEDTLSLMELGFRCVGCHVCAF